MNPIKKIWFDENSTPPKNMIWYRGEGKFYEWKNNDWVLCYNLVDVATQEQIERNNYVIAQALVDLNERIINDVPKPIIVTGIPDNEDTLQDIYNLGFTLDEIRKAAEGKRMGVIYKSQWGNMFFSIVKAEYSNDDSWEFAFEYHNYASGGGMDGARSVDLRKSNDNLYIEVWEL